MFVSYSTNFIVALNQYQFFTHKATVMWEDVINNVMSPPRHRVLSPLPETIQTLPVIESKISFLPFINYVKSKRPTVSDTKEKFFDFLIEKLDPVRTLTMPINENDLAENYGDVLELLGLSLFPLVGEHDKNSFAFTVPYSFKTFYYSECFEKLFTNQNNNTLLLPEKIDPEKLKAIHCAMVYEHALEKFYGVTLNESPSLIYPVIDAETSLKRYYKIHYDRRFTELKAKGKLPLIQDCAVCLNTFRILDIDKQLETMPLDLFEAEGFGLWVAEDVTTRQALDNIKKMLLRQEDCGPSITNEIKMAIQSLVGINDLQVGLMPFLKLNDQFVINNDCVQQSIIAKKCNAHNRDDENFFKNFIEFIKEKPEPVPISVLNEDLTSEVPYLGPVFNQGIRSYIVYPMHNSNGLVGLLELGTDQPGLLNNEILLKIEPIIPLLSVAMQKNRNNFSNQIEKVIKEKFTALQQSVEWKFAEAAWQYLSKDEAELVNAPVIFENVYPLFGAIDIRNSSLERTFAIQKDLKEHLTLITNKLDQLEKIHHLDLIEDLKFKTENFLASIKNSMLDEDEIRINEFVINEVEPLFSHLQKKGKEMQKVVADYFIIAKDLNSYLFQNRKDYEESLANIIAQILAYLEKEEEAAQKSFPHYFEKYRSDGVEYNIYIGQSIAPSHPFDMLYLRNIRLWQLKSMAEIARITHKLKPSLKVPLQTTQLILIHNQSISISFRKDEKRFDVDGSYDIRYDVIKKRLDKASIKSTHERLTQPGKVALVYSNYKELQEYQEYIAFLQNKNILKKEVELLELEELQGINGLKAIRIPINLEEI